MADAVARVEAGEEDPACLACGGIIKAATVSFGQSIPPEVWERAEALTASCDAFVAVGSSLVVQPAASLPVKAARAGAALVIVNREPTPWTAWPTPSSTARPAPCSRPWSRPPSGSQGRRDQAAGGPARAQLPPGCWRWRRRDRGRAPGGGGPGEPVPVTLDGADGLVVLGGAMDFDETDDYPHLARTMDLLADAAARSAPALGICLGAQLAAAALGGRAYQARPARSSAGPRSS